MSRAEARRKSPGAWRTAGAVRDGNLRGSRSHQWPKRQDAARRESLDEAKARVTISAAWRSLGLPGEPRRSCRSPFREDRHLSFPGFQYTRSLREHATAEFGDAPTCVRQDLASGRVEVLRRVLELSDGVLLWHFSRALFFKSSVRRSRGGGA